MSEVRIPTQEALRLAQEIASRAHLASLVMLAGSFRPLRPEAGQTEVHAGEPPATETLVRSRQRFERREREVAVAVDMNVRITEAALKSGGVEFFGQYELVYGFHEPLTESDEQVACFARINGVYNVWPYWREFVANMAARMAIPHQLLDLLAVAAAARLAGYREDSPPGPAERASVDAPADPE